MATLHAVTAGTLIDKQIRYPHIENEITPRSHTKSINEMKMAYMSGKIINGFKGISTLAVLPKFDIINGFPIDYMHSVLLGVVKTMLDIWFDSKNHGMPYYIGLKIKCVDEILLKIKPPTNISRIPKSIGERSL